MGRASMTRKPPSDGDEDEACVDSIKLLPDLVEKAVVGGVFGIQRIDFGWRWLELEYISQVLVLPWCKYLGCVELLIHIDTLGVDNLDEREGGNFLLTIALLSLWVTTAESIFLPTAEDLGVTSGVRGSLERGHKFRSGH